MTVLPKKKQEKWKMREEEKEEKSEDENTPVPAHLAHKELDNNHSDKSGPALRSDEIS